MSRAKDKKISNPLIEEDAKVGITCTRTKASRSEFDTEKKNKKNKLPYKPVSSSWRKKDGSMEATLSKGKKKGKPMSIEVVDVILKNFQKIVASVEELRRKGKQMHFNVGESSKEFQRHVTDNCHFRRHQLPHKTSVAT